MILAETLGRRANGANPPRGQIIPAAHKIDDAILNRIEEKSVDREIPAAGIFLGASATFRQPWPATTTAASA